MAFNLPPLVSLKTFFFVWAAAFFCRAAEPLVKFTMIDSTSEPLQADAHLLEIHNGSKILIDVGHDNSKVVDFLKKKGISQIDRVLISHAHKDHYSGIRWLIKNNIQVGEFRMNIPPRHICDAEKAWGCQWGDIQEIVDLLKKAKIPLKPISAGDEYIGLRNVKLKTLYAFDGIHTPVGETDVNDMSAVMKLTVGKTRVLFTGDLNEKIGTFLASKGKDLRSDILKIPHHGGESTAPNTFLDRVAPKLALVPAPKTLWQTERCRRIRIYLREKRIETYVSGIEGDVVMAINPSGYEIVSPKRASPQVRAGFENLASSFLSSR